jgi:DNA helicase-2/ATP-dependent DNA helicase PcrA
MKPTLIIAGPGSGKTYNMVKHVAESTQMLDHGRILSVITFTNAATESIRSRLLTVFDIPPNVFIGTTFSFFNRFIIQPYASIFEDINQEKIFLEIDINSALDNKVADKKNYMVRNAVRKRLMTYWLAQGCIPISEIGRVAAKIIQNNKRVRDVLCNRVQYLFIDEFQDIDTWQFQVFDEIRKGKKTKIYAVGDPEQYISGYTYQNTTAQKPKSFTGIPILKFDAEKSYEFANRRSFSEIVQFTNHFHTELDQKSERGSCSDAGVYFLSSTDINTIIKDYRNFIEHTQWHTEEALPSFFYLAFENKLFGDIATKYDLTPITTKVTSPQNHLDLAMNLLSAHAGISRRELLKFYRLSRLQFRELGVQLVL